MNADYIIGPRQPHILFAEAMQQGPDRAMDTPSPVVSDSSAKTPKATNVSYATPADETSPANDSAPSPSSSRAGHGPDAQEVDNFSFKDLLDILNPLQHLPIISTVYRAVTGDEISSFAKVAGGALFGGPLGLVGGAIDAVFSDETGKSAGETVLADLFGGGQSKKPASGLETQVASATPVPAGPADMPSADDAPDSDKTLDSQVASAIPAPVSPSLYAQNQGPKQPFGGVMDAGMVQAAAQGAPNVADASMQTASASPPAIPAASSVPHAPDVINGQKFYSLANAKHYGGEAVAMPVNPGPDVRLKPISHQAYSGVINRPSASGANPASANTAALSSSTDAQAAAALGLMPPGTPLAAATTPLTPADVDLLPGEGASQALPAALIQDMMQKGLEKYQQGLQSGAFQPPPAVDVRG